MTFAQNLVVATMALLATPAGADATRLRVTFQPDCFRPDLAAPCDGARDKNRLDPGPQIAVWLESADGGRFVDTILVTNLTAAFGIGNRVGFWRLPSGPKYPYGKRVMALPVWAHRRGRLYDTLVNQAGAQQELSVGGLEPFSSPEPYFCRPLEPIEVVDAISCPTPMFSSAKGRLFDPVRDLAPEHLDERGNPRDYVPPAKSYYPPRNELRSFTVNDCDDISEREDCPISARRFAETNDLDAVAAPTPPYGRPFTKTWQVPDELPDGDYALLLEVSKEYDTNRAHMHAARPDRLLEGFGIMTNLGQPSVVFRVPFRLDRTRVTQASATGMAGYGDWTGATGVLHPPDRTISESPGSGVGRLLAMTQPALSGTAPILARIHVLAGPLDPAPASSTPPFDSGSPPPAPPPPADAAAPEAGRPLACTEPRRLAAVALDVPQEGVGAEKAALVFLEPTLPDWEGILEYELRYWNDFDRSDRAFSEGTPLATVPKVSPGQRVRVDIPNLKALSSYTVGVRPRGDCLSGSVAYASFRTIRREFKQLSGCFIATAAWGAWSPEVVDRLRTARNWLAARSAGVAFADALYARSSPPVAAVLGATPEARAVVRAALGPLVRLIADR
jgi:hypothetical protein